MKLKWLFAGLAALGIVGGGGYAAVDHFANAEAKKRAEIFARDMRKHVNEFTYGSVKVSPIGQSIEMRDVAVVTKKGERVKVASVTIKNFDWTGGATPRYADIVIAGADLPSDLVVDLLRLPLLPRGETKRMLDKAGYGRALGDIHVGYRYDEATREFEIRDNRVELAGLGTFTLNLKFGNVQSIAAKNEVELAGIGLQATLVGASLVFRDATLVSRMIKAYAADKGLSEAEAQARFLADIRAERERQSEPLAREGLDALARFVERPGEIGLAVSPATPYPLMSFFMTGVGDVRALKQRLGLTIAAR